MPPESRPALGRYEVLGELGRGGMGRVLRGRDPDLGRELAIKVLLERYTGNPDAARRFLEEARIAGQLQHPGIVPLYEVGRLGDRLPYFTMKVVEGHTLAELLGERTAPGHDLPRFLWVFEQVCQTVAYAHSRGVIHRDLKPANVMVGAFGEVQVMDWGLAKRLRTAGGGSRTEAGALEAAGESGEDRSRDPQATSPGTILGTYAYMPPEQARGEIEALDERADVFALGAILCKILTGAPPFSGAALSEQARRDDLTAALARLATCGAEGELIALATRCLEDRRDDRPREARELADGLAAYREGVERRLREAEQARREAERARDVEGSLVEVAEHSRDGRWDRAWAALERAEGRVADSADEALRARVRQARAGLGRIRQDQEMLVRLEAARFQASMEGKDGFDQEGADRLFRQAFAAYGLDPEGGTPEEAGDAVAASGIAEHLVIALDFWSSVLSDPRRSAHLLEVADRADRDEWRRRLRRAIATRDCAAVRGLLEEPPPEGLNPSTVLLLAADLRGAGEPEKAWQVVWEAHRRNPGDFWLCFYLGAMAADGAGPGGLEEAVRYYTAAVALRPTSAAVHTNLGVALKGRDRLSEAVAALKEAIRLNPAFALAHNNLGNALYEQRLLPEAVAAYREAIRLNPEDPRGYLNLGVVLYGQGNLAEAVAAYREAIRLRPEYAKAHFNLGVVLTDLGQFTDAVAHLRRANELDWRQSGGQAVSPDPEVFRVERFAELDEHLSAFVSGGRKPAGAEEALNLALLCQLPCKRLFAAAVRFFTAAFRAKLSLTDDLRAAHHYNAACCAALAGCLQGEDSPKPGDKERARLRRRALDWLRAELTAWGHRVTGGKATDRAGAVKSLTHWRNDADLGGVRDREALSRLPPAEERSWRQFWVDVKDLLRRARQDS
jgi:serine/threonine-protein kinase